MDEQQRFGFLVRCAKTPITGPNVYNIDPNPPAGCTVDQAIYVLRHGSRYPDPSAYQQWQTLYQKLQAAKFTAFGPLAFLNTWQPVSVTQADVSDESITGYREAFDLGVSLRSRYPTFYTPGDKFWVYANDYPRVVETAQNWLRAYVGVNASYGGLGTVYALNSKTPDSLGNSLSPSDLCPNYVDNSGTNQTNVWNPIYLKPVLNRLKQFLHGNLNLTTDDIDIFPYLCGFETSITGIPSPFCGVFTDSELQGYEYQQSLRYYYGNGPANPVAKTMMLPFLSSVTGLLTNFSSTSSGASSSSAMLNSSSSGSTPIQPLTMAFLNDGQISQLAAAVGVFDSQSPLPDNFIPGNRLYYASRFVSMRGTISFERLSCPSQSHHGGGGHSDNKYVRIKLNDAVYTVPSCRNGPGGSCEVSDYANYVAQKYKSTKQPGGFGGFLANCGAKSNASSASLVSVSSHGGGGGGGAQGKGQVPTQDLVSNFWSKITELDFVRAVTP